MRCLVFLSWAGGGRDATAVGAPGGWARRHVPPSRHGGQLPGVSVEREEYSIRWCSFETTYIKIMDMKFIACTVVISFWDRRSVRELHFHVRYMDSLICWFTDISIYLIICLFVCSFVFFLIYLFSFCLFFCLFICLFICYLFIHLLYICFSIDILAFIDLLIYSYIDLFIDSLICLQWIYWFFDLFMHRGRRDVFESQATLDDPDRRAHLIFLEAFLPAFASLS